MTDRTGEPRQPGQPGEQPNQKGGAPGRQPDTPAGTPAAPARWPQRRLRMTRYQRFGDSMMSVLTRWSLVPHMYLLTAPGRRTGELHTNPVTLVEEGDRKWLVAPYGPVGWVHNVRAAGEASLRRGSRSVRYSTREVSAAEAGPVLKKYVRFASATRPYFEARKDAPVEDFTAEAGQHPVFELTRLD